MREVQRGRAGVLAHASSALAAIVVLTPLLALGLSGCNASHLPKAPPPPTGSEGATTTTAKSGPTGATGPSGSTATTTPKTTAAKTTPARATTAATTTSTTAPASTTTVAPATNVQYNTTAQATYAVGPEPGNWDIHSAAAGPWRLTLAQVLAQVWPSAFYVSTTGSLILNSSLLSSAVETSPSPQTVVYKINPRAVWSDGMAITFRDFAYNWQAQSGRAAFTDAGGHSYTPVDEAGYRDISNVSGSPDDPYTVTVTFSSPYPDWRSLFSYLMPAHVGQTVGFDSGFTDPVADLVSGGPYLVSSAQPGYSLELVRNSRYWGSPANLAAITYYFTDGAAQVVNALSAGEVDVAMVAAQPATFKQLQSVPGISVHAVASSLYEDLDFNERAGFLPGRPLRQAIMMAVDRSTMAEDVLGPFGLPTAPVENRAFLAGQPGYVDDGATYDQADPAGALSLLAAAGYTSSGGALHAPGGAPVTLSLVVGADDPVAVQLAALVAGACQGLGIRVTVSEIPGASGTGPPAGAWDMALELREVPVDPYPLGRRYATGGAQDVDGFSGAAMNALLARAVAAPASQWPALYDEVDQRAWSGLVDLPLVQVPVVVAVSSGLLNVSPGPYFANLAWDEQGWGFQD